MPWQLTTAISVLALAFAVILQRALVHKDKIDPFGYVVVFQALVGVPLLALALVNGFTLRNLGGLIVPALIACFGFGIGHMLYAKALQRIEASVFAVLFASHAIWIMLLGIVLFDERLSLLQVVGSVLIFLGVVLSLRDVKASELKQGLVPGLLTGLLFGIAITAWSYVGRQADPLSWAAVSFFVTSLAALIVAPGAVRTIGPILRGRLLPKLILLAAVYGMGSLAMLYAYRDGSLAVVSPLRQSGIIVTILMAVAFLPSERHDIRRKLLAGGVCTAGVLLLVL